MKMPDISEIPHETLMDFINGEFELPEERNMGDDVDFLVSAINKICMENESIRSLDKAGRAHLFECLGAYCFNIYNEYKGIDIEHPEDGFDKSIQAFYLKACEWNEEMKAMKRLAKKFTT